MGANRIFAGMALTVLMALVTISAEAQTNVADGLQTRHIAD